MARPKIDSSVLQSLQERDVMRIAAYSSLNLALFCTGAVGAALVPDWWMCVPFWLVTSLSLVGFSNAAHECTHNLYARSSLANRVIGSVWMLPLLLNFGIHRRYHLTHHRFTKQPEDPEFDFDYESFGDRRAYLKAALRWVTILDPLHKFNWTMSVKVACGRDTRFQLSERDKRHVNWNTVGLVLWIIASVGAASLWEEVIWGYWIPLLFGFPLVAWFTAVPEHYGTGESSDAAENTRTIDASLILRTVFWNFNFHTAHHAAPGVPFHNLPELDALLANETRHRTRSYIRFHRELLQELGGAKR